MRILKIGPKIIESKPFSYFDILSFDWDLMILCLSSAFCLAISTVNSTTAINVKAALRLALF